MSEPTSIVEAEHHAHSYRFAVWIFIASEALLFAALFGLYTAYRAEYSAAFGFGASHVVQWIGGLITMLLLASSFAMAWSVHHARAGRDGAASRWLLLVLLLGTAFMALKLVEWFIHIHEGVIAGTGYVGPDGGKGTKLFFTLYYLMTGLHMFHLAIGIGLVVWMFLRARAGRVSQRVLPLELVALYWNFVDLIWMFLWPMFYLMRTPS